MGKTNVALDDPFLREFWGFFGAGHVGNFGIFGDRHAGNSGIFWAEHVENSRVFWDGYVENSGIFLGWTRREFHNFLGLAVWRFLGCFGMDTQGIL